MPAHNLEFGKIGEDAAVQYLKEHGYAILERNYRCRLGEMDIVAKDAETICFVEVKTRSSGAFGTPQEALTRAKQRTLSQVALTYLKEKHLLEISARFDVVCVFGNEKVELIKDAFELDSAYSY